MFAHFLAETENQFWQFVKSSLQSVPLSTYFDFETVLSNVQMFCVMFEECSCSISSHILGSPMVLYNVYIYEIK